MYGKVLIGKKSCETSSFSFNIPLKPFLNPLNSSYLLLSNVKIHTLLNPISLIFLSFLIMILVIFSAFIIIYTGWMIYQVRSAESN